MRALIGMSLGLAACGPATAPPPQPPPPSAEAEVSLLDAGWAEAVSPRQQLSVPLPDYASWRLDDSGPSFFVTTHLPTQTRLIAGTWREARSVSLEQCAATARLRRPAEFTLEGEALDRQPWRAPADFAGELVLGVSAVPGGFEGRAVAVGHDVGRCYAAALVTRTKTERELGDRLALLTERSLQGLRLRAVGERATGASGRVRTP